jgi:hypothetical protein
MAKLLNPSDMPAISVAKDIQEYIDANPSVQSWPLTAAQAFEHYCDWNGLLSWGNHLYGLAIALQDKENES